MTVRRTAPETRAPRRLCVVQPDYAHSDVDYRHYDPPRDLTAFAPRDHVDHLFLDKRIVYRQLRACATRGYDVFINLCEGYLDWDVPSIDVIHAFDALALPYTGPTARLYDPAKPLMKYAAQSVNVATPRGIVVRPATFDAPWVQAALDTLPWPQFVKPAHAGDSRGIDEHARVATTAERTAQVERLFAEFGSVLVEEYVDGPEYTVLVARTARGNVRAYPPVRYDFAQAHTVNGAPVAFKSYALKTSALAPHANVAVPAGPLADALVDASTRIFNAFGGVGYARLDFRADARGTLHFLEINFTCSVFYPPNLAGSADHILAADPSGHIGFLECIIDEAIARHARTRPAVELRPVPGDGYGTFALRTFATGDVVFALEHTPIPLMTEPAALRRFQGDALRTFRQYAWPIAPGVYGTWHDDPAAWRPQNHSCDANSAFAGLDVVATRPIAIGDEVTLDYALAMDDASEPFDCRCGSARCRGRIVGSPGNSVSARVMHTTRRQR